MMESSRYEQFILFPRCFQKTSTADTLKPGLVWEKVKIDKSKISAFDKVWLFTKR